MAKIEKFESGLECLSDIHRGLNATGITALDEANREFLFGFVYCSSIYYFSYQKKGLRGSFRDAVEFKRGDKYQRVDRSEHFHDGYDHALRAFQAAKTIK